MSIVNNKKAYYDFFILEEYQSGIVLQGSEVKSMKEGNVTLLDSFIYIHNGEVWIKNLRVSRYKQSHPSVIHEENRDKKLLLSRKEINKISRKLEDVGTTCVPLSIFVKNNKIKVNIGVVKGKKLFDKRATIKDRDLKRDLNRDLSNF
jgi:SsrA-binding protein